MLNDDLIASARIIAEGLPEDQRKVIVELANLCERLVQMERARWERVHAIYGKPEA